MNQRGYLAVFCFSGFCALVFSEKVISCLAVCQVNIKPGGFSPPKTNISPTNAGWTDIFRFEMVAFEVTC